MDRYAADQVDRYAAGEMDRLGCRLTAFIQHQYFLRQDMFVDIFLRSVRSAKNAAARLLQETEKLTRGERKTAIKHLTKTRHNYRNLIDEITVITKSENLSDSDKIQQISKLLDEHQQLEDEKQKDKIAKLEKSLDDIVKDKNFFDALEKQSVKLQNRVSDIVKTLEFNPSYSDQTLISAIKYFKKINDQNASKAPDEFLTQDEKEAIINEQGKFKLSLYKILFFMHTADAVKSGQLNLKHSYRYLSIQDYLIEKEDWDAQRSDLLRLAGLEHFSEHTDVLANLKAILGDKYHSVNRKITDGLNPHISFNEEKNNRFHIITPAIDEKESSYISDFLDQVKYIPIIQLLSDIDQITKFSKSFKHHAIKHVKNRPDKNVFLASVIGLGCNIGINKMAQISDGINQNTMSNTVNWYFSQKNINDANEKIRLFISELSLPLVFKSELYHGSSDGRKVGVSVDCLLANYSFKYFGKDKGVSVYNFIDDRQVLFHHNVMSASEREAAYVIDGLNNMNTEKIDIHSTDTHGFSELVFATTHFLDVSFAPRIKNIGKQRIYAFSSKETYQNLGYQVLPSRTINQKLIISHWEDILRFMATIRLNKVSASQLFKRLSFYAKDNPLYKAIKEFGRIIKSLFILTYLDDVKLRQRIEKQLNRVESSNKFSRAIFYANNGEFWHADPEEQNMAEGCKVLLQNSIVLWNYLYLSQLLTNCANDTERNEMLSLIKESSVLCWAHINLHGEFDFKRRAANDAPFDLTKILSLKVA